VEILPQRPPPNSLCVVPASYNLHVARDAAYPLSCVVSDARIVMIIYSHLSFGPQLHLEKIYTDGFDEDHADGFRNLSSGSNHLL